MSILVLNAQIIPTDGTELNGPDYTITADLGDEVGSNLFHSFSEFNINTGESATFTGPGNIEHVISRVTGANLSTIDGLWKSEIAGADFYFINPNGVVFGPNMSLDITGSFYVSTGDYVRLGANDRFYASLLESSVLSMEAPEAFGFLSAPTGTLTMNGTQLTLVQQGANSERILFSGAEIEMDQGANLQIQGGVTIPDEERTHVVPPKIDLISVASDGEVEFSEVDEGATLQGFTQFGSLQLLDNSTVGINSARGGRVTVHAGNLSLANDSEISSGRSSSVLGEYDELEESFESNTEEGIPIGVRPVDRAPFLTKAVNVSAEHLSLTTGSKVILYLRDNILFDRGILAIEAGDILIDGSNGSGGHTFTGIFAQNIATKAAALAGNPGAINEWRADVNVSGTLEILNGGRLSTSATVSDSGVPLPLNIEVSQLFVDGGHLDTATGLFSQAQNVRAGDLSLSGVETLQLLRGGRISTTINDDDLNSNNFLVGGDVTVSAKTIVVDRQDAPQGTGIFAQNHDNLGSPGRLVLQGVEQLTLLDGGRVSASTFFGGFGGNLTVRAGAIHIDHQDSSFATGLFAQANSRAGATRNGGRIRLEDVEQLEILNGGRLSTSTSGGGDAGTINIQARNFFIDAQHSGKPTGIFSQSNETALGRAGDVTLSQAESVTVVNGGAISTSNFGASADLSVRGNLSLETDSLVLESDGTLSASTFGTGTGGSVNVQATSILIDGKNQFTGTGIFAQTNDTTLIGGDAGSLQIGADHINLLNGGRISTSTLGGGQAGAITLGGSTVPAIIQLMLNGGRIESASGSIQSFAGLPGTITITTTDAVHLLNGSAISVSAANSPSDSMATDPLDSSIFIEAPNLVHLQDSEITTSIRNGASNGGNITITEPEFIVLNDSRILANADAGNGGNITLIADNFIASQGAEIQASSRLGADGQIQVLSPDADVSAGLLNLNVTLVGVEKWIKERCAARQDVDANRFVITNQSGISSMPEDLVSIFFEPTAYVLP